MSKIARLANPAKATEKKKDLRMIKMADTKETRLSPSAVTSYYPDKHIYTMQNRAAPSIQLTIGSCPLELIYESEVLRDADLKTLDCWTISDLASLDIK